MVAADSAGVWITGMAWETALGGDHESVWEKLLINQSGIASVDDPIPLRSHYAATLTDLAPEATPQIRQIQLTSQVLKASLMDAGIAPAEAALMPILGTSFGAHLDQPDVASFSEWANLAAADVGCANPPLIVTTACSAGADALLMGLDLIRSGAAEQCVCGGADVLTFSKRMAHSNLGTLASGPLRPFDAYRDGTQLGEGAAFLVLEAPERARARGARAHAALIGGASCNDAVSAVAPDSSGANIEKTVVNALSNAGIRPEQVSVINAHGSGTAVNDEAETQAYNRLFVGQATPPVLFATKGAFGHTLGATGALEAVTVVMALQNATVPPIAGLQQVISALDLPVPIEAPMAIAEGAGISITLGFGGFNTCLVFQQIAEGEQ